MKKLGGWPWPEGEFLSCFDSDTVEVKIRSHKDVNKNDITDVKKVEDLEAGTNGCDYPFLIKYGVNLPRGGETSCLPQTRIGKKKNDAGSEFSWICRHNYFRATRTTFDDLGLIGYNPKTGDTCF